MYELSDHISYIMRKSVNAKWKKKGADHLIYPCNWISMFYFHFLGSRIAIAIIAIPQKKKIRR